MDRLKLGGAALGLFAAAAALYFWELGGGQSQVWIAGLLRVAVLAGAGWLAWPQLKRFPPFLWVAAAGMLALLALRPRYFLLGCAVLLAMAVLRPRPKKPVGLKRRAASG
jgi:hypothetical protein